MTVLRQCKTKDKKVFWVKHGPLFILGFVLSQNSNFTTTTETSAEMSYNNYDIITCQSLVSERI